MTQRPPRDTVMQNIPGPTRKGTGPLTLTIPHRGVFAIRKPSPREVSGKCALLRTELCKTQARKLERSLKRALGPDWDVMVQGGCTDIECGGTEFELDPHTNATVDIVHKECRRYGV